MSVFQCTNATLHRLVKAGHRATDAAACLTDIPKLLLSHATAQRERELRVRSRRGQSLLVGCNSGALGLRAAPTAVCTPE